MNVFDDIPKAGETESARALLPWAASRGGTSLAASAAAATGTGAFAVAAPLPFAAPAAFLPAVSPVALVLAAVGAALALPLPLRGAARGTQTLYVSPGSTAACQPKLLSPTRECVGTFATAQLLKTA